MKTSIDILMATCNGGNYLSFQVDSILRQTNDAWTLLIRDDGSVDGTLEKVHEYSLQGRDKIKIIESGSGKLGASQNFGRLLELSSARYVMFCDQDDVWLPEKIEVTLREMQRLEKVYGERTPILVHTDLKVVDEGLKLVSESFWNHQNIHPKGREKINYLLTQNCISGCTMMINASLRELASPIPEEAIMHDWWLALVASAFGKISHIDKPTMLYRQHQKNDIGANKWGMKTIIKTAFDKEDKIKSSILRTQRQSSLFLERYFSILHPKELEIVKTYSQLVNYRYSDKIAALFKYKIFKKGFIRNIGFIANI